jgi:RNA polymerase sigma-70 factor (ECF subfamily)
LPPLDHVVSEEAIRASYAAHGGELYRFAWSALRDPALAEEAVQETFLRAWRVADRYDAAIGSPRTWLFAIARNVIIDLGKARTARERLREELVITSTPGSGAVGDGIDEALLAWEVEEALRRLTPEHRAAIVELYYRQRPAAEVAAELGIPAGTLRSRLYYGLRALRLVLEEMGWVDEL